MSRTRDRNKRWLKGLVGLVFEKQVKEKVIPKLEEVDPTGLAASAVGAKLDSGKLRVGLVLDGFARAIEAVAKVGTDGAEKYSDNGWMEVEDGIARYADAMYRHRLAEAKGEVADQLSGSLHAAHEAWNALAKLELMLRIEAELAITPPLAKAARAKVRSKVGAE